MMTASDCFFWVSYIVLRIIWPIFTSSFWNLVGCSVLSSSWPIILEYSPFRYIWTASASIFSLDSLDGSLAGAVEIRFIGFTGTLAVIDSCLRPCGLNFLSMTSEAYWWLLLVGLLERLWKGKLNLILSGSSKWRSLLPEGLGAKFRSSPMILSFGDILVEV